MNKVHNQHNNRVVSGFTGTKDFRYHPTKGYRLVRGFNPNQSLSSLEGMVVHEEPVLLDTGVGVNYPARTNKKGSMQ